VKSGWRVAVLTMAVVAAVVGLPASAAMRRDKAATLAAATAPRGRFELNRATGMLLVIGALLGVIVAGLVIHLVPMLVDRGMPPVQAAGMAASVGLAVAVARVLVGWLFDRFHAPYVACLFLLTPIVSCLLLRFGGPVLPAALGLGLAAGAEVDMMAFLVGRYAHMRNYGATYGGVLSVFCLGAAFGPLLFGKSVDMTGNYNLALGLSAVALLAVVGMIGLLGPYRQAQQ
ncbi:MAG TPA: MFS transporter, partial [Novosphingobium sp.]|nr:MFS transporter [Novosphingobium sp.]